MSNDAAAHAVAPRFGLNELTLGLIAAAILLFGAVFWSTNSENIEKTDFSLTYAGATIVHRDLAHQLYDLDLQRQIRDSLFKHPNPLFFEHPPFEAVLLSPLAASSFRSAYLLWGCFNATLFLFLMFFMRRHLPAPREDLAYIALWILFAPTGVALFQGQSSLILLAAYCAAFVMLNSGRHIAGGFAFGLGLFKFQFVMPFLLIVLICKKWRFLFGFCMSAASLGTIALSGVGVKGIVGYIKLLSVIGSNPQNLSYGSAVDMPTIYGFVYALTGGKLNATESNICVVVISIALLVFVAWQWSRKTDNAQSSLVFSAAISAALLCGSHMFTHDFSPLLLAMFIGLANLAPRGQQPLRAAMIFNLLIFWFPPIYFILVAVHGLYLMCPVLLLFVFTAVFTARRTQVSEMDRAAASI
jgi:Glycosyltransferase family 87